MFVSELMSRCVAECTEDLGLAEVYELIRKCEHGLVVVIDSNAHRVPIGVVSDRSILEQIVARGRNPRSLIAGSVIDSRIKVVSETDLVESIPRHEIGGLAAIVVVNEKRQVCGLVPKAALANVGRTGDAVLTAHGAGDRSISTPANSEIPAFGWVQ